DPEAVAILLAAFDAAWQSIKASGPSFTDKQKELVRTTLATYIIEQARRGELDQRRLSEGAVRHLAQSNLRPPTYGWQAGGADVRPAPGTVTQTGPRCV